MNADLGSVVDCLLCLQAGAGPQVPHRGSDPAAVLALCRRARRQPRCDQFTPALVDEFLASRPRSRPAASTTCSASWPGSLDWAVAQELLADVAAADRTTTARPRGVAVLFDLAQARLLLDAAAGLARQLPSLRSEGTTYRTIFALCYGLGLRSRRSLWAATVRCRHRPPASRRPRRQVRQGPLGARTGRGSPSLVAEQVERRPTARL